MYIHLKKVENKIPCLHPLLDAMVPPFQVSTLHLGTAIQYYTSWSVGKKFYSVLRSAILLNGFHYNIPPFKILLFLTSSSSPSPSSLPTFIFFRRGGWHSSFASYPTSVSFCCCLCNHSAVYSSHSVCYTTLT